MFLAPFLEKEQELDNSAYSNNIKWTIRTGLQKVNCTEGLGKCVPVLPIFELIKCPTNVQSKKKGGGDDQRIPGRLLINGAFLYLDHY